MKIEIDLKEFWLEEEDIGRTVAETIKRDIVYQVKNEVLQHIREKLSAELSTLILNEYNRTLADILQAELTAIIDADNFVTVNGQKLPFKEYILSRLAGQYSRMDYVQNTFDTVAKQFAANMKTQYDQVFATQIVKRIGEQGMLRDDVAKLLLGQK